MIIGKDDKKELRGAIVETIAFFDLFDFPLTKNEIVKYLQKKATYLDVSRNLDVLCLGGIVGNNGSLYFLSGKEKSIEERKKRYNYSDRKFKIALRIGKYFRYIPWIQLICVANIIGRDNLRDGGDIDLFIVSDKGRLWLTRFFCVLIAKTLNVRPQKEDTRDKICLSFFVSEDSMNLEEVRGSKDDLYFSYWFLNLASIYSQGNTFFKLMEENKKIIEQFPNYFVQKISEKREIKSFNNNFYNKNWELLFGGLEQQIKKFQLKIIPKNLLNLIPEKKGVIISDKIIKLHLNDRRDEFLKKYNENISKISID